MNNFEEKKNRATVDEGRNFMKLVFHFFPMQFLRKKKKSNTLYLHKFNNIYSLREIDGVENEFFASNPMATTVGLPFTTSVQHRIVGHVAQISQVYGGRGGLIDFGSLLSDWMWRRRRRLLHTLPGTATLASWCT